MYQPHKLNFVYFCFGENTKMLGLDFYKYL